MVNNRIYFSHRDESANIIELQTYLRYLSRYYPGIPQIVPDGIFGPETKAAVIAFQKQNGLSGNGEVDFETWTRIVELYDETVRAERHTKPVYVYPVDIPHFKPGDSFEEIYILQIMLRRLAKVFGNIHLPKITGVFDADTKRAVEDFARLYGKKTNGLVDRELWNIIADTYSAFTFND